MHTLPISSCLSVKHSILVLGQHLILLGHLMLPSFKTLRRLTLLSKCGLEDVNDTVDLSKALALSEFPGDGQLPWNLPESQLSIELFREDMTRPASLSVGHKGDVMAVCDDA